jgi:signal transduction histidine kinase
VIARYAVFQGTELVTTDADEMGVECYGCAHLASPQGVARSRICPRTGREAHVAWTSSTAGWAHEIVVCSDDSGSSNRRMNTQLRATAQLVDNALLHVAENVGANLRSQAELDARRVGGLMHNLVTYNAKSRQALELIIPEADLAHAGDKRVAVEKALQGSLATSADSVLKVIKNLALTSAEFRVWNYLYSPKGPPRLEARPRAFHKLVKLATNVFWPDLIAKGVRVDFGYCDCDVFVDFDSFLAALTHLLGNAAKYALPDGTIRYEYEEQPDHVTLTVDGVSLYVHPDERQSIWKDEVRGREAMASTAQGTGLGLGIIRQLLQLNRAELVCSWGDSPFAVNGRQYSHNRISVSARRTG